MELVAVAALATREAAAAVEAAVAEWRAEARKIGMSKREIDEFVDAFEHPERAAARRAS